MCVFISGTIQFSNIGISGAAFAGLDLPFKIRRAEIGLIKLQLPVWNLLEESCSLEIEHVRRHSFSVFFSCQIEI